MQVYHWSGSAWERQTGTTSQGGSGDEQWVRVEGISAYSPFALNNNNPTAVTVYSLSGHSLAKTVLINWPTASNLGLVGFNLYRATSLAGPWEKINNGMIPVDGGNPVFGGEYQYEDTTAQFGVEYIY